MPGFFGDQAARLLRCRWRTNTDKLAEELFAMFAADKPMTTDQPLTLTRNGETPAVTIIDNTGGNSPPIQIIQPVPVDTPVIDPGGNGSCCGGGGGSGGGGGGGQNHDPPDNPSGGGGDPDPPNPPPPTPVPYRFFQGTVKLRYHKSKPDPYGFDNKESTYPGSACLPYNPPTITGPSTAFVFPQIQPAIDDFIARWHIDGYTVISDDVVGPLAYCTPEATPPSTSP
jgi:hypothetical protein